MLVTVKLRSNVVAGGGGYVGSGQFKIDQHERQAIFQATFCRRYGGLTGEQCKLTNTEERLSGALAAHGIGLSAEKRR